MRFAVADQADGNRVTGYRPGVVSINGVEFTQSLLLLPDRPVIHWPPRVLEELAASHFEPLLGVALEVVLLGVGERQRFPSPALYRTLIERRIGVEVMTTGAACRTYNILLSDRRRVAAALIL